MYKSNFKKGSSNGGAKFEHMAMFSIKHMSIKPFYTTDIKALGDVVSDDKIFETLSDKTLC